MFDAEMLNLKREIMRRMGSYEIEIGALTDRPERIAKKEQKRFFGGPANKAGKNSNTTVRAVLQRMDAAFNLLLAPWSNPSNKNVALVLKEILVDMNKSHGDNKRIENAALTTVRNSILRGEYGSNSPETIKQKGFDRLLINTGTMFSSIKARLKKRV